MKNDVDNTSTSNLDRKMFRFSKSFCTRWEYRGRERTYLREARLYQRHVTENYYHTFHINSRCSSEMLNTYHNKGPFNPSDPKDDSQDEQDKGDATGQENLKHNRRRHQKSLMIEVKNIKWAKLRYMPSTLNYEKKIICTSILHAR